MSTDFLQLDAARAPRSGLTGWLAAAVREAIADGRLPVGAPLPATRELATQLGVSRGVVVEAYRRLGDEGLVRGDRGAGTRVAATRLTTAPVTPLAPPPAPEIDLRPGLPDLSAFPRSAWLAAQRRALTTLPATTLGYGDPRGTPQLREALAAWLARSRGLHATAHDVLVVNGVAQGLSLLTQILRATTQGGAPGGATPGPRPDGVRVRPRPDVPGVRVAFEEPGSAGTRDQLVVHGCEVVPVPVDDEGLDVDALAATGAGVVVVTPAHQFPTGVVLGAARRRALVAWAHDTGGLIVEDDYDAEHRYDRPPVAAVQPMAPERVVYLGSVSKTLAPALRLGWVVPPSALRAAFVEAKQWNDISTAGLGQLALAELVTSGGFDRHLRAVRGRQRTRRDALLAALATHLPDARVHGVAAGLHLMVTLPGPHDDAEIVERALAAGVDLHALSRHRVGPGPAGLVIGYAAATPDRIHEGVRRLATLLA